MIAALLLMTLADPTDLVAELRSDDPAVRLRAVQEVERAGADGSPDQKYLAPLATLLADGNPQTRGLAALALWRHVVACQGPVPEGVVGPLLLALGDSDPHFRAYCGRSLVVLGERALPEVTAWLEPGRARVEHMAAIEGCRRLAANPAARLAVDALLWQGLGTEDAALRERAFLTLQVIRREHTLPPFRDPVLLAAALRQDDVRIRSLAVLQLSARNEDVFPLLADLLDDESPLARAEAAKILERLLRRGFTPRPDLTTRFLRQVQREDPGTLADLPVTLARIVRDQAVLSLRAVLRVDEVIGKMIAVGPFGDPDAVAKTLALDDDLVKVLENRLLADDPKVQAAAACLLRRSYLGSAARPTGKTLTSFARALRSQHLTTAQEVAVTLASVLDPELPIPDDLLEALRSATLRGDALLLLACSRALASCGKRAEGTLVALLDEKNEQVQIHAAEAIFRMVEVHRIALEGTREKLTMLRNAPAVWVREAASRALNALDDASSTRWAMGPVAPVVKRNLELARDIPLARLHATRLVAENRPDEAFLLPLAKLLGDPVPATRALAAQALTRRLKASRAGIPDGLGFALTICLEDENDQVRAACHEALLALGEQLVPQWRMAMTFGKTRDQRLAILASIGGRYQVEAFRQPVGALFWELLTDRDIVVRGRALASLQVLGRRERPPIADLELLSATLRSDDKDIRALASDQLSALGAKALPALVVLFDDENPYTREEAGRLLAAQLLRERIPLDMAGPLLLAVARRDCSEFPNLPSLARQVFREKAAPRMGMPAALRDALKTTPAHPPESAGSVDQTLRLTRTLAGVLTPAELVEQLHSDEPATRLRALQCLDRLGKEDGPEAAYVPALALLLFDPDKATADLAAKALTWHLDACRGKVPDGVMIALLLGQGGDGSDVDDPHIAATCADLLKSIARTPLTLDDLVAHRDGRVREAAAIVRVARLLKDRKALPPALALLGKVLIGPDQEARRAAALAVGFALQAEVRVPSDVLLGLRLGIKSADDNLRAACVEALAACGAQGEASLCDLLDQRSPAIRRSCVEVILRMIERTGYIPRLTAPYLRPLLESPDPDLRQAARRALTAIEGTGEKQP
jgi:hypothetical protein